MASYADQIILEYIETVVTLSEFAIVLRTL